MGSLATSISFFLLVLSGAGCFFHFPTRFSTLRDQQNSLSPIGTNSDGGASLQNWVQVSSDGPGPMRLTSGDSLRLTCEAVGSPIPRLQWFKASHPLTQEMEEDNTIRGVSLAKMVLRLEVDCVTPADAGTYACTAVAGSQAAVTAPLHLIVDGTVESQCIAGRPHVVSWMHMLMQTIGSDAKLPCQTLGADSVRWISKDGKDVGHSTGSRIKMLASGELVISRLRWSDMGTYTCVAENSFGHDSATTFIYPLLNEV